MHLFCLSKYLRKRDAISSFYAFSILKKPEQRNELFVWQFMKWYTYCVWKKANKLVIKDLCVQYYKCLYIEPPKNCSPKSFQPFNVYKKEWKKSNEQWVICRNSESIEKPFLTVRSKLEQLKEKPRATNKQPSKAKHKKKDKQATRSSMLA